jgi:FK506-binding protein 15
MLESDVFQVQANNYATFYDDQVQNWSVMFESSGDAIEFAKEVSRAGNLLGANTLYVFMSGE